MKYFDVSVEEVLGVTVRVKAASMEDAIKNVNEQYDNHEIVLDSNNFGGVSFSGEESDDQDDEDDED